MTFLQDKCCHSEKEKKKNCKYEISDIGLQRDLSSEQILIILASGKKKFTMKIRIGCYISVKPHETTAVYTVKTSLYYLNVALPFLIIRAANNISLPHNQEDNLPFRSLQSWFRNTDIEEKMINQKKMEDLT